MTVAPLICDLPTLGRVYLVGAGPGDPELLTCKAYRLMQATDIVLYDRLVSPEILRLLPQGVERIAVGKEVGNHCTPQARINHLLIQHARAGKRVLRLKGGDPYLFGRGGEEAVELAAAGIPFEVVPGITSAAGAASYAGIPLTHRDYAQAVTFVTGHQREGAVGTDWAGLARARTTLVVYMGMSHLGEICAALVAHGRSATTPAAVVENATRADQRVVVATLSDIAERAAQQSITAPASVIIGEVVALQESLGASASSLPELAERSRRVALAN